jgi:hypothetical protein
VGCDNDLHNDDDDDKSPDFYAGMGAIMTAGVRRPEQRALAAIAFSFNGVQPALLHAAAFSQLQLAPSSDVVVFLPSALCLP